MPRVSKRRKDSDDRPQEPTEADAETALSFEQAVERVEAIIERIESGEAGLEDSIAQYEKGVVLLGRCRAILDRAEQRIEELTASPEPKGRGAAPRDDDGAADADDELPL